MKILLPVDGSDFTKLTLNYLRKFDKELASDPEYIAFTAVIPIPNYPASFLDRGILDNYYDEESEKILKPVLTFASKQDWNLRVSWTIGHAVDEIIAIAKKEQVDLIIMGTHGHSGLKSMILGSVSSGVLARSKIPVLLVRE